MKTLQLNAELQWKTNNFVKIFDLYKKVNKISYGGVFDLAVEQSQQFRKQH